MSPQPRKRFGQHWLRSEKALHQILEAAALSRRDRVLEIGPGTGILTRWLVSLADTVIAVEVDWDLCKKLTRQFAKVDHFLLLQGDILDLDLTDALATLPNFQHPNKVVANIPYYITGSILEKLLGSFVAPNPRPFESIVLLLQRQVADRLYAQPSSKAFGALSVRVQYLANCELICPVPASAFYPPPKVESAIVRLQPRLISPAAANPHFLDRLVRLGFASKRKMLRNNLPSVIERDRLIALLETLSINPQARAEDLSVSQWVTLSNKMQEMS